MSYWMSKLNAMESEKQDESALPVEPLPAKRRTKPVPREPKVRHVDALVPLLDRDLSILAFHARVLDMAQRADVPLLERLKFLCIVSSNLDEFFEVRGEPHLAAFQSNAITESASPQSFQDTSACAHAMVARQYELFNDVLHPALAKAGIELLSHNERTPVQRRWVEKYFNAQVRPLLVPVSLDPSHPFPQVANKSLNFIVQLTGKVALGRGNEVAIVRVPRSLPRIIQLPAHLSPGKECFVSLTSVIRAHLGGMFVGRVVDAFSQFRVTRHSDLSVDEDEVKNLRTALRQGLHQRNFGAAVRIEVSSSCSDELAQRLLQEFGLPQASLYRVKGPVNLVRYMQLCDMADRPELKYPLFSPEWPKSFVPNQPMFAQIAKADVLTHHPFESFDAVLHLLKDAVNDPDVLAIKQTIYRTGADPRMLELYRQALQSGKEVLAVVELKARFDEEANINWAEQLERLGAQVVYGVVGMKTHAKMLLVTRREGGKLRRYGHVSTGNYNPRTARLYTDIGHFTADPAMTADMDAVFAQLASHSPTGRLKRLLVAPQGMQSGMIRRIKACAFAAASGAKTRIVAKMNALTDVPLIDALVAAGQSGVRIDLIVRGACMLAPQIAGITDNIRVRSVVGRFLEHSRIFCFNDGESETMYLASADWMTRNMVRRIEIAWPLVDAGLRQRVWVECLQPYLNDTIDGWELGPDGTYAKTTVELGLTRTGLRPKRFKALDGMEPALATQPYSAHAALMALHEGDARELSERAQARVQARVTAVRAHAQVSDKNRQRRDA